VAGSDRHAVSGGLKLPWNEECCNEPVNDGQHTRDDRQERAPVAYLFGDARQ
jgi:hypothetical protein